MTTREKFLREAEVLPLYYLLKQKGGVVHEDASLRTRSHRRGIHRGLGARSA